MKSLLTAFVLGFFAFALHAQSEQTIFKKTTVKGGFGGPTFSYGQVKGHAGYGAGGGGGVVFENAFLGFYGQGEVFDIQRDNKADYGLALGHGGLWVGYSFPTRKAIHLIGSVKVGGGAVGLSNDADFWTDPDKLEFDDFDNAVFVAIPEVGIELNLFHWMRVSGTVGYRYLDGFKGTPDVGSKDMNAPVFGLAVRFGWFGHRGDDYRDKVRR